MTIQEFINKLSEYPLGKEVVITGYLPEYTYKTKIISWTEDDNRVEILTDVDG